jgi:DNA recombination protein RmuC
MVGGRVCVTTCSGADDALGDTQQSSMGFRTLSVQKRSSEVWNLLGAVKTEWSKYDTLEKVQKKLHEASETIEKAQVRTRAIGRKLRDVQDLPAGEAQSLLMIESNVGIAEAEPAVA